MLQSKFLDSIKFTSRTLPKGGRGSKALRNKISYPDNSQSRRLQSSHGRSLSGPWRVFRDLPCRTAQPPPGPSSSRPAHLTAWPAPGEHRDGAGETTQILDALCVIVFFSSSTPLFFFLLFQKYSTTWTIKKWFKCGQLAPRLLHIQSYT